MFSLLRQDWLRHLRLDWPSICKVQSVEQSAVTRILDQHKNVFREELGTLRGFEAKIYVDPTANLIFARLAQSPMLWRSKVEEELERLVKQGILEPMEFAEWAAPIVPVVKSDKSSVRICGDNTYPISKGIQGILFHLLLEAIRLASCPVTSYWWKVCTHSVKNSSNMSDNHGNRKLNM